MTAIGHQVCRLIEKPSPGDLDLVDVIDVHVNAMKLVITNIIKEQGGKAGENC